MKKKIEDFYEIYPSGKITEDRITEAEFTAVQKLYPATRSF